jgi:L-seryl-tRNA(Ser) seleniumtransferase
VDALLTRAATVFRPSLVRVVNATGVIIHTNLGRAPLPAASVERIVEVAGYSNLELDLETLRTDESGDDVVIYRFRPTGSAR